MLLLNESWNGDKYDSRKHDKAATLEWLIFSDGYEVLWTEVFGEFEKLAQRSFPNDSAQNMLP